MAEVASKIRGIRGDFKTKRPAVAQFAVFFILSKGVTAPMPLPRGLFAGRDPDGPRCFPARRNIARIINPAISFRVFFPVFRVIFRSGKGEEKESGT